MTAWGHALLLKGFESTVTARLDTRASRPLCRVGRGARIHLRFSYNFLDGGTPLSTPLRTRGFDQPELKSAIAGVKPAWVTIRGHAALLMLRVWNGSI